MKFKKNQSPEEQFIIAQTAVANNSLNPASEKLKCIKNTKTGKVDRKPKSICEDIIKDNPDWHFTTKKAYERIVLESIPKGATIQPGSSYKPKGKPNKGQFKDKLEKQIIVQEVLNPDYVEGKDVIPIYSKVKETVPYTVATHVEVGISGDSTAKEKEVETSIKLKVPSKSQGKVIGYKIIPKFIKVVKSITHLLVHGKRTSQLVK